MTNWILLGVGLAGLLGSLLWRRGVLARLRAAEVSGEAPPKKAKRVKTLSLVAAVIAGYLAATRALTLLFGESENEGISVSIWPERVDFFGFDLSMSVLVSWAVMAVLILGAVLLRLTVLNHMTERPGKLQNLLELMVETVESYTDSYTEGLGKGLPAYIFTVALFLVGCASVELFGFHPPTADITVTFALALVTFFLINYYGIRRKGVGGRLKSLAEPTPVVFPIRVVSDCAVPVSMACRLFGNMLGGMIVMNLLYTSLGNNALGIPSVVGLYFNVFHPLIQAFIFVTLTLTFIKEAAE